REVDAVLGILSSLLRISRIESLDPGRSFRVVDMDQVTREVAELFDAAAEEQGSRVIFESCGRVSVLGDRDLLFDAISNLIDNAIKHGDLAGHLVHVDHTEGTAWIKRLDPRD